MSKIFISIIFILLTCAVISDIKTYKINNAILLPFMIFGIAYNSMVYGIKGLGASILGMVIPFVCLFVLFALRMLGAGDIKLVLTLGAMLGYPQIMSIMIYSFISGGIIAMLLIILRKNSLERIKYMWDYFNKCIINHTLLPYSDFDNKSAKDKFRFSFAVLAGTIVFLLI